jgi:hypothetical protein
MKTRLLFLFVLFLNFSITAQVNSVSETFEAVTENQMPAGWQKYGVSYPSAGAYTFSTWAYQGSKSLMINNYTTAGDVYIILPQTTNARGVLSFYARSINGNATIQLGSATSNTDMTTFTPIGSTYTVTASYANINLDLNTHTRNDDYVVIRATNPSTLVRVCLDNVTYNTTCQISGECTNNSLNFDGVNDRVVAAIPNASVSSTGTIEAWIKTSDAGSGYRGIVVKSSHAGLFLNDNKLMTYVWSAPGTAITIPTPLLNDGQWHHVALTFQMISTNNQLYLDGVAVGSPFYMNSVNNSNNLNIGSNLTTQYFNGNIDGVKVWSRRLTAAEILDTYNCGTVSTTNLIAHYNFDNNAIKNQNNTGITSALNDTGAGYNGTLENFTLNGTASNYVDNSTCTTLSVENVETNNNSFFLYPNPANDIVNISLDSELKIVEIYNLQGQKVLSSTSKNVIVSNLSRGIYMVRVESENGSTSTQKLVKQ